MNRVAAADPADTSPGTDLAGNLAGTARRIDPAVALTGKGSPLCSSRLAPPDGQPVTSTADVVVGIAEHPCIAAVDCQMHHMESEEFVEIAQECTSAGSAVGTGGSDFALVADAEQLHVVPSVH